MSGPDAAGRKPGVRLMTVELVVAALLVAAGAVVMADSLRVGAGWESDGPQAGYFPFYVGLLLALAGAVNFVLAIRHRWLGSRPFASYTELGHVLHVLVPTTALVVAIAFLGLYVASAVFIAWFMLWHGRFRWTMALPVALGVPVVLFLVFERWFLVPLPKGPLEAALGF